MINSAPQVPITLAMNIHRRALDALALSALAVLSSASLASAASGSVSGKIRGAQHYTLLALAPNGSSTVIKLGGGGSFRIPSHRGWTLQLLSPDSHYFGPIVLRYKGTRGWEALSGTGAALGTIVLHKGYAAPQKQAPAGAAETGAWLHVSRSGAPTGAGNLGLIATKGKRASARIADTSPPAGPGPAGGTTLQAGADPDQDGIPTAFDADATGAGEPSQENTQASQDGVGAGIFTEVQSPIAGSVNADAESVTTDEMTQFIHQNLGLAFAPQDPALGAINSVSVDCGALTYCATATVGADAGNVLPHGSLWNGEVPAGNSPGSFQISLQLSTTPSQIQPGDTYEIQYSTPNGIVTVPAALTLYLATVPAVSSIGEGTGAAAASGAQPITYPASPTVYGSPQNPVMLTGDSLNLSFWRPQRAAFPGETGPYVDMGHLHYGLGIEASNGTLSCPASDYSGLSSTLGPAPASNDTFYDDAYPLLDSAADAAPAASNELGFTVNLINCLNANSQPTTGREINVSLNAADDSRNGSSDSGQQSISVCLPGCTIGDVQGPGGSSPSPGPGSAATVLSRRLPALWPSPAGT